jgi:hypothetical protein
MSSTIFTPRRELDQRVSGGLEITLYWNPADDSVSIEVVQPATGETIMIPVASDRALEAFQHPFAQLDEQYAAHEAASVATG